MKNKILVTLISLSLLAAANGVLAGGTPHTVYGYCYNASDGTPADGANVTTYIETRPGETLTDTVGATGNSGIANGWLIDAGNFTTPWLAGEVLIIEVDNGVGYTANTQVTLTTAGADQAPDMTLTESIPPETTDDAPDTWQNSDVTVTLTCTDTISGCAETHYSTDGSDPATLYGGPFDLTASGEYQLKYYSVDNVGNTENVKTGTLVKIDKETPETNILSPNASSWQKQNFQVNVEDSDTGGSGLYECSYRVKSNGNVTKDWTQRDCSLPVTLTVGLSQDCQDQGTDICKIFVKAEDTAGNIGTTEERSFSIDYSAPVVGTVEVEPSFYGSAYTNSNPTISAAIIDEGGSIINSCKYQLTTGGDWFDASWNVSSNTCIANPTGLAEEEYQFNIKGIDNAGNEGFGSPANRTVDTTSPEPPINLLTTPDNSNIILTWGPSPSTDVAFYNIYISDILDGFNFSNLDATVSVGTLIWTDINVTVSERYYIVRAEDIAQNESDNSNKAGKLDINLYKPTGLTGQNLIYLPFDHPDITTAEELGDSIPGCDNVAEWNPLTQQYLGHPVGTGFNNFNLTKGNGYFVSVIADTSWTMAGAVADPITIDLYKPTGLTGQNLIGLHLATTLSTAEELGDSIPGCDNVAEWNPLTQQYLGHPVGTGFNNFNLTKGNGYFVSVIADTSWTQN